MADSHIPTTTTTTDDQTTHGLQPIVRQGPIEPPTIASDEPSSSTSAAQAGMSASAAATGMAMMSGTGLVSQQGNAGTQALDAQPAPIAANQTLRPAAVDEEAISSDRIAPSSSHTAMPSPAGDDPDALPAGATDSSSAGEVGKDHSSVDMDSEDSEGEKVYRATPHDLFIRFASKWDLLMNAAGLVAAVAAGASQPLMTIVFGSLTTAFLQYSNSLTQGPEAQEIARRQLQNTVNSDALLLLYIGIAMFAATYIYSAAWVYTGEEISRRIREAFLASILRQDIAFFDKEGAGSITTRLQSDTHLIQDGISDKIPMSVMMVATFISQFISAVESSRGQ